jgi:indolepyruvate ferredoxin oxidoreductase
LAGEHKLTTVVAQNYFKLLAYKDEYEVARLYRSKEFRKELAREFTGDYRIRIWLAPPFLARTDPVTRRPRKSSFGPWILPLLGVLARLRWLRGTRFDPFGWTSERRQERALITEYEEMIGRVAREMTPERYPIAVELGRLPERIRGFGPIKVRSIEQAQERKRQLLVKWELTFARDREGSARRGASRS